MILTTSQKLNDLKATLSEISELAESGHASFTELFLACEKFPKVLETIKQEWEREHVLYSLDKANTL